ncbi:MAG: trypsin-like serine protease [Gammaproteobacteria bacterium]|nr:trypsin-like serine protease [Gammaproteobacteria bacterium]
MINHFLLSSLDWVKLFVFSISTLFFLSVFSSVCHAVLPDFVTVFEANVGSVVTIKVEKENQKEGMDSKDDGSVSRHPKLAEDSKLKQFFEKHFNGKQGRDIAIGAGVVATTDGYLFTASHLVGNAKKIWVLMDENIKRKAKLIGKDGQSDIAIIKIKAKRLKVPVMGNSNQLKVGQWVMSIGTPFGFEKSASQGIISALNRQLPNSTSVLFIQTDVAVNPGNSGGPIFNTQGELIGINSQIYSKYGGYQGVSFAVPIENALDVLKKFVKQ